MVTISRCSYVWTAVPTWYVHIRTADAIIRAGSAGMDAAEFHLEVSTANFLDSYADYGVEMANSQH